MKVDTQKTKLLPFIVLLFIPIIISVKYPAFVDSQEPIKRVIGKGKVVYTHYASTREIKSGSGFVLKEPDWIMPPNSDYHTFLEPDSVIKPYENKKVYIEGRLYEIPGKKINSYTFSRAYDIIEVDTIYLIK